MNNYSSEFKKLYEEECRHWSATDQQRFLNIPNSHEEVDEEEIDACREFIEEVTEKIRKLAG